jgi:hypothetical protein
MTSDRCPTCEFADRDLGILIASRSVTPSQLTDDKVRDAYVRLSAWVGHLRVLSSNAAGHLATLKLPTLLGTAYLRNVMEAVSNPRLQDPELAAMRAALLGGPVAHSRARRRWRAWEKARAREPRSVQDDLIASALVFLLSGARIWPVGARREHIEELAEAIRGLRVTD